MEVIKSSVRAFSYISSFKIQQPICTNEALEKWSGINISLSRIRVQIIYLLSSIRIPNEFKVILKNYNIFKIIN